MTRAGDFLSTEAKWNYADACEPVIVRGLLTPEMIEHVQDVCQTAVSVLDERKEKDNLSKLQTVHENEVVTTSSECRNLSDNDGGDNGVDNADNRHQRSQNVQSRHQKHDSEDEIAGLTEALFDETSEAWVKAEDSFHNLDSHRIVHLHAVGHDKITKDEFRVGDLLSEIRARILRSVYTADDFPCSESNASASAGSGSEEISDENENKALNIKSAGWGVLKGRPTFVRCFEYHHYQTEGSVMDEAHRDQGSLVTISVLISKNCNGGVFRAHDGTNWNEYPDLRPGDAIVFNSEKRHGVTPLVSGTREALVMEFWADGVNKYNRHK
jgi:hypothetical protein